jgi:hypothetical protein
MIVTNVRYGRSGSSSVTWTVLAAARSTPRIHVASSAMSAVRKVTSSVAGSSMLGGESMSPGIVADAAPLASFG